MQQCAAAHWPASVAGCQDEVSALSTSNLETTGQEVLECFDRVLGLKNNQRCLDGSQVIIDHKCRVYLGIYFRTPIWWRN